MTNKIKKYVKKWKKVVDFITVMSYNVTRVKRDELQ